MRGNNRFQNWLILFIIGFSINGLCAGYAETVGNSAAADKNMPALEDTGISHLPSAEGFIFSAEYEDDFKIKLIDNSLNDNKEAEPFRNKDTVNRLDAFLEYKDRTLSISGVEAFDMSGFLSGKTSLAIDYRMIDGRQQNGLHKMEAGTYDLGNIPLFLTMEEPYWRLSNKNGVLGIGIPDIGIPDEIYELLPENIGGLYGYNTIASYDKGVVKGTIVIRQIIPYNSEIQEISLSCLGLSDELNRKIIVNQEGTSILEIMADYYFCIPFGLNTETSKNGTESVPTDIYRVLTNSPKARGKITLKSYIKVIHDIEPVHKNEFAAGLN